MSKIRVVEPEPYIVGVKDSVAEKVFQMLKDGGKRSFGVPGAYMSHQAFNPQYTSFEEHDKKLAEEMLEAQRDTFRIVKDWVKDKPNAVLISSVKTPGVEEENRNEQGVFVGQVLDLAVLFGEEVVFIDTVTWKKNKVYTIDDDGSVLMTNKPFPGNVCPMLENVDLWLEYLNPGAMLTGLVCVNNEDVKVVRTKNWFTTGYRLVEKKRFIELLDEKYKTIEEEDRENISSTLVAQMIVRLQKPFDVYEKVFAMDSLREFRKNKTS